MFIHLYGALSSKPFQDQLLVYTATSDHKKGEEENQARKKQMCFKKLHLLGWIFTRGTCDMRAKATNNLLESVFEEFLSFLYEINTFTKHSFSDG